MHKGKIIVFGILFWYPLAGVTFQFLHYLIALRRLGYDVYYVEDSERWIYDKRLGDFSTDASANVASVAPVLEAHGFAGKWAFRGKYSGGQCYGMSESAIDALYRDADAFLNVTAAQELRDEHLRVERRIYVESDPFASQVKVAKGDAETIRALEAHDTLFTFGENIGAPDCAVPVERLKWLPTRQPVLLDLWPVAEPKPGAPFNTITTWHNKWKSLEWRGETWFWTKDREFRRFITLPELRPEAGFELATTLGEYPDAAELLVRHRWRVADGPGISSHLDTYRDYIRHSRGEFTVARDQYVRPKTGWFSDRTACYLAAGRPVITQETGFSKFYGGKGLFGFATIDDILAAVDAIEADYAGHCRAARELAEEYFAAEKVVGSLMQRAGLM